MRHGAATPLGRRATMLLLLAATAGVLVFKGRVEDLGDNGVLRSDCPPQADCLGDAAPPRRPSPAECPPQADFLPQGILPMFQADTCINSEEDVHPLTPRMASEVELVARDECKGLMLALQGSFRLHRKLWEFCAILKAFRVLSDQPKSALVFAVGTEPLPAFFAHLGVPPALLCAASGPDLRRLCLPGRGWNCAGFEALLERHIPPSPDP